MPCIKAILKRHLVLRVRDALLACVVLIIGVCSNGWLATFGAVGLVTSLAMAWRLNDSGYQDEVLGKYVRRIRRRASDQDH